MKEPRFATIDQVQQEIESLNVKKNNINNKRLSRFDMEIRPWDKLLEVLPPLANYEFEALRASVAEHGVLQRVLVLPDGRIIDGYHRWKIVGDEVPKDVLPLDEQSAFLLGLAMNTARRQMSPDQIKELRKRQRKIALELRKPHGDQPPMSQEKVAGVLGVARQTIDLWEGTSIASDSNTCNPPDLRIKVTKKERTRIKERAATGESQSQIAADYKLSQQRISQIAKRGKEKQSQEIKAGVAPVLRLGDFRDLAQDVQENAIDLILTDPPYPKAYLPLWNDLAREAARVLKPSGFLIAYSGQNYLPQVLNSLSDYLSYYWLGMLYLKGKTAQQFEVNMWNRAKPILFFQKPPRAKQEQWLEDVLESPEEDKNHHAWGQNVEPLKKLLKHFSLPGHRVLEPFAGGGSTIQACIETNRSVIAFEQDERTYNLLKERFLPQRPIEEDTNGKK